MKISRLLIPLLVLSPCVTSAQEEDPSLVRERYAPGREGGELRLTGSADYVRGSQGDAGGGIVYGGWTFNDLTLQARYFGKSFLGGFVSAERMAYQLYGAPQSGTPNIHAGLFSASVGPAARLRLGKLNLEGSLGYSYGQLPEYGSDSARAPVFTTASRHAIFIAARAQYALPLGMVLEARGMFPFALATTVPQTTGDAAFDFSYGGSFLVPVFSVGTVSFRLGLDFTKALLKVTAKQLLNPPPDLQPAGLDGFSSIYRVGLLGEAVLGGPIPPPPLGNLRVKVVRRKDGSLVAGATVRLEGPHALPTTLVTGEDGTVTLQAVRTGTWTAAASADALLPSSGETEVREGGESLLSVALQPPAPTTGTVRVVVVEATGNRSLNKAVVKAGGLTQPVGEDGTLELKDVRPGPYPVKVTVPGYKPGMEVASVVAGQTAEVVVKLFKEAEIQPGLLTGHIRSVNGSPVAAQLEIPQANLSFQADEKGNFSVKVPPGRYQVTISAPGYITQTKSVTLRAGDEAIFNVNLFPRRN